MSKERKRCQENCRSLEINLFGLLNVRSFELFKKENLEVAFIESADF